MISTRTVSSCGRSGWGISLWGHGPGGSLLFLSCNLLVWGCIVWDGIMTIFLHYNVGLPGVSLGRSGVSSMARSDMHNSE